MFPGGLTQAEESETDISGDDKDEEKEGMGTQVKEGKII